MMFKATILAAALLAMTANAAIFNDVPVTRTLKKGKKTLLLRLLPRHRTAVPVRPLHLRHRTTTFYSRLLLFRNRTAVLVMQLRNRTAVLWLRLRNRTAVLWLRLRNRTEVLILYLDQLEEDYDRLSASKNCCRCRCRCCCCCCITTVIVRLGGVTVMYRTVIIILCRASAGVQLGLWETNS